MFSVGNAQAVNPQAAAQLLLTDRQTDSLHALEFTATHSLWSPTQVSHISFQHLGEKQSDTIKIVIITNGQTKLCDFCDF